MRPENVVCPACGARMISRKNSRTDQRFWGCVNYPACRGTRNTDGEAPVRHEENTVSPDSSQSPSSRWRAADRDRWLE